MIPEFHPARGYRAFDSVIRGIEKWLGDKAPSVCGYSRDAVAKRLAQKVVEIGLEPFMREGALRYDAGIRKLPSQDRLMRCGGVVVNTASGKVTPTPALLGRSIAEFLLFWTHVLYIHIRSSMHLGAKHRGPGVVFFGVGDGDIQAGGSDARFLAYCRKGPVVPLAGARHLVVQAVGRYSSSQPEFASYGRFPLHVLVAENLLSFWELLRFLAQHMGALGMYFSAILRCPLMAVLGRDLAYHAMVAALNHRGLIEAVVLTNSNYLAQPLWVNDLPNRCFKSHMVWYSTNNTLPVLLADPIVAHSPSLRHIRVDEVWTWSDWHVRELKTIGVQGTAHVVGPILWYLPELASVNTSHGDIRIAVFDVTPVKSERARSLGFFHNYYRAENVTRFMEDILWARTEIQRVTGRRVRILLKHKRSHKTVYHDSGYISFIERISGPDQVVELLPPDSNMYSLISGCDLTLVIPYSSPAYVATSIGCPAIYYDPTMEVQPVYDEQPFLTFVAGRDNLVTAMRRILDGGATRAAEAPSAHAKPLSPSSADR